jgi:chromosomal replication initiator protein
MGLMEQEYNRAYAPDTGASEPSRSRAAVSTGAERAWALSKAELRRQFGESHYKSYIERLDLALDGEDEREFLARDGGAQTAWLNEQARDIIARRMSVHTHVFKPVRICGPRDLSPLAAEAIRERPAEAPAPAPDAASAPPPQRWPNTFDTLCAGAANSKAIMLGHLIAARSAQLRMVLFRGDPGVGKTHLVESIANEALERSPSLKVRLVNGQRFSEDFIDHLKGKRDTAAFKANVRDADILIIDDIPRVAGRKHTEEELYDAIMSVYSRGGFVVLTAVAGQSGVAAFGDRLAHHLKCATECDIELPDEALRRQILEMRVGVHAQAHEGFAVAPEALDMIATRMPVSGRELDGAVNQLVFEWLSTRAPITLEQADTALRSRLGDGTRKVTVDMIKAAVARHYQMTVAELLRKTREKAVSHPRQLSMYLTCKLTTLSLPNIARLYGGYDHTTVLYAKRKIGKLLQENAELRRDVEEISRLLRQPA